MSAAVWDVGVKVVTGGVTFIAVEAADAARAHADALAKLSRRGYRVGDVVMCSERRGGTHHLVAMFDGPAGLSAITKDS